MAVRPATRGGNGMLYGLIAFVIVSVASLGAFIWQLTNNQELVNKLKTSTDQIRILTGSLSPIFFHDLGRFFSGTQRASLISP